MRMREKVDIYGQLKNSLGNEIFHWSNMTKVKDGDIIFSMYKRNLVSINIANG